MTPLTCNIFRALGPFAFSDDGNLYIVAYFCV